MDTEPLTNCYRSHQAKAGRKAMSWQGAMRGYRMALPALREMWASFRKPGGCIFPSQDQEGERPSADPCEQQARQGGQEPPAQIRVTEQQIRPRTHDKGKTKEEYQRKEQLSHQWHDHMSVVRSLPKPLVPAWQAEQRPEHESGNQEDEPICKQ